MCQSAAAFNLHPKTVREATTGIRARIFILKPADQDPAWDCRTSDPSSDVSICLSMETDADKGWRAQLGDGTGMTWEEVGN